MKIVNLTNSTINIKTDNQVFELGVKKVSREIIMTRNTVETVLNLVNMFGSDIKIIVTDEDRYRFPRLTLMIPPTSFVDADGVTKVEGIPEDSVMDEEGNSFTLPKTGGSSSGGGTGEVSKSDFDELKSKVQSLDYIVAHDKGVVDGKIEEVDTKLTDEVTRAKKKEESIENTITTTRNDFNNRVSENEINITNLWKKVNESSNNITSLKENDTELSASITALEKKVHELIDKVKILEAKP